MKLDWEELKKTTRMYKLGLILVAYATLSFPVTVGIVLYNMSLGETEPLYPELVVSAKSKIVYYIAENQQVLMPDMGGYFAIGSSLQSRATIQPDRSAPFWLGRPLLERQGDDLFINEQFLEQGETYLEERRFPHLSPWLFQWSEWKLTHGGMLDSDESSRAFRSLITVENGAETPNALFVHGTLFRAWFPSPFGLVILGAGILMMKRGQRSEKEPFVRAQDLSEARV